MTTHTCFSILAASVASLLLSVSVPLGLIPVCPSVYMPTAASECFVLFLLQSCLLRLLQSSVSPDFCSPSLPLSGFSYQTFVFAMYVVNSLPISLQLMYLAVLALCCDSFLALQPRKSHWALGLRKAGGDLRHSA